MSLLDKIDKSRTPQHVAIIMDGNGRWAQAKGLQRVEGHKKGVEAVRKVVEAAAKASVKYLTIYAFSTENWDRPAEEVDALMDLTVYAIVKETPDLLQNGIRLKSIGEHERLPEETRKAMEECIEKTSEGQNLTLTVAISYSSKWELTDATRKIAHDVNNGTLREQDISEKTINNYLATCGTPNPDLMIRTGGEHRISNFLLWQAAYSEFYFTDTFWPDFGEEELYEAIIDFQQRERRYGKTSEQLEN
jgi:undecaprenyl diphosphate synthase